MTLSPRKTAEQLIIRFCEAYQSRDMSKILALFTENTHMWGTGIDESRIGLKEIEQQLLRDWAQSEKGQIEVVSFIPSPDDQPWVAVVTKANLTVDGEQYTFDNLRGSIFIAQEDNTWKISHMHSSFPDMRNGQDSSFPIQ